MKAEDRKKGRFRELWNTLGRSLYVSERLKANLLAISAASLFCVILGLALLLLNLLPGSGTLSFYRILMSAVTIISGTCCFYIAYVRKDRKHAVIRFADSGKIEIPEGVMQTFYDGWNGDTPLRQGMTYTAAELPEHIAGAGAIHIARHGTYLMFR